MLTLLVTGFVVIYVRDGAVVCVLGRDRGVDVGASGWYVCIYCVVNVVAAFARR